MQQLIAKQQPKSEVSLMEESHKELVKWRSGIDHHLTEIMASLKGVQDSMRNMYVEHLSYLSFTFLHFDEFIYIQGKYGEFTIWKTKVEQQFAEITNKLSDLKASRECVPPSSPSDRWKDWIENTNLPEDEFATWIGSSELLNVPPEMVLDDPNTSLPTHLLSEGLVNKRR
ncbi:hypothetical protein Ahy_A08g041055 isoform F [Arachis hypogaea]|uniref:Uncharacterized protein n=1 Tax=Arachis hypogaea TaxID=3818 RepID=A0A445C1I2_ARAHY|nr:hypothetical protein Ahy_A08g041055 isoform F [Arachis hypogaea]